MSPVTSTATIEGPGSLKFFTKTWTPAAEVPVVASVIFVHGFVEHITRYDHVFSKYAEEGIAVFAFDQRGFGETAVLSKTPGRTSWAHALHDISFFITHVSALHPSVPLFLQGHSMGGGLSLAFATRTPASKGINLIKGVLVSSPLLRQAKGVKAPALLVKAGSVLGMVAPGLTMKAEVKPTDICRDPVVQKAYAEDPLCRPIGTYKGIADMLLGGEALVTKDYKNWPADLPLLIVHGTGDLVTDCDASKAFVEGVKAAGAKDATFTPFEGFYHEMHNEPGEDKWTEIAALTSWIKSKL